MRHRQCPLAFGLPAVVRDHPGDFAARADLHVLAGLRSLLVRVVEDDALEPPHDVHELKAQVRVRLEPALEIGAERSLSGHLAGWIAKHFGGDRRDQHDVVFVVRHDAVEVVAVPGLHPVVRQFVHLLFPEHSDPFNRESRLGWPGPAPRPPAARTTLVLPSLPENLVSKTTLVWLLRNQTARPQRVEASYLTSGITWKADYVMVLNAADTLSDLTGWVTIDNKSGATYGNAALKLVAGDVNRAQDPRRDMRALEMAAKAASPADASRDFKSEGFFEYHLYSLDGRTTIKDNQTKQLSLLAANEVPITKELIYYGAQDYYRNAYGVPVSNQKIAVYLEIKNSKENRLGLPLPKGKIRVYKADGSGSQQFIGEDWIDHTPKDERVKIKMGNAFDLVGERTQKDF